MISQIKKILSNYFFKGIILIFIAFFVFGGIFAVFLQKKNDILILNGAKSITKRDFHKYSILESQRYYKIKEIYNLSNSEINELILNQLKKEIIVADMVRKIGFIPSNKYINRIIKNDTNFQKDGIFNLPAFNEFLQKTQITEDDYREHIRRKIQNNLINIIFDDLGSEINYQKLKQLFLVKNTDIISVNLFNDFIELNEINELKQIEPDFFDEISKITKTFQSKFDSINLESQREYYNENKHFFSLPEIRNIRYVIISNISDISDLENKITDDITLDNIALDYDSVVIEIEEEAKSLPDELASLSENIFSIEKDLVSYPMKIKGNQYLVYEVKKIFPERIQTFEEVKGQIITQQKESYLKDYNIQVIKLIKKIIEGNTSEKLDKILNIISNDHNIHRQQYKITQTQNSEIPMILNMSILKQQDNIPLEFYSDDKGYICKVQSITFDIDQNKKQYLKSMNHLTDLILEEIIEKMK